MRELVPSRVTVRRGRPVLTSEPRSPALAAQEPRFLPHRGAPGHAPCSHHLRSHGTPTGGATLALNP